MERNITNLVYDIQRLDRDIRRNDDINKDIIKFYVYRSNMLRKFVDKIIDNQKNYPSYISLNLNEQQKINYAYTMLNQIDLNINNLQNFTKKNNDNQKIPFSFRSFILVLTSLSVIVLYYRIFIK
jgi:hypothetical protein